MRILRLSSENIKRIKAVEIRPTGDLVVIGGRNDQGKSSLLDSIEMALGGEAATPSEPVRRGKDKGKVVLDLGDLLVTREFGAGGQRKLVVANKDGARFPSPQAMLDKLYSQMTFDPLAFEREDPDDQADILRRLVKLDTSDLDDQRIKLYDRRSEANKEVKALEVKAASLTEYLDTPADYVSMEDLTREMDAARELQTAALKARHVFEVEKSVLSVNVTTGQRAEERIEELEAALVEARADLEKATADIELQGAVVAEAAEAANQADTAVPDIPAITARMNDAARVNEQVRTNIQHRLAMDMLKVSKEASAKLTWEIEKVDEARLARLAAVQFPVPGLGIEPDGVTLGGLPFEQASTSDRIRVSVAIGLAMNPTLRVLLVRDGSLLGEEKLRLLAEMAKESGSQIWLEMLQEQPDGRTSVFIEDGSVRKSSGGPVIAGTDLEGASGKPTSGSRPEGQTTALSPSATSEHIGPPEDLRQEELL